MFKRNVNLHLCEHSISLRLSVLKIKFISERNKLEHELFVFAVFFIVKFQLTLNFLFFFALFFSNKRNTFDIKNIIRLEAAVHLNFSLHIS